MNQDISTYVDKPLHTAGLPQAAHQQSLQDVCGCAGEGPCSIVLLSSASQATSPSSVNFFPLFRNEDEQLPNVQDSRPACSEEFVWQT